MAKVIAKDNLVRDYQPERLITVSVSDYEAKIIAEALNNAHHNDEYFEVKPDSYELNLESMYECSGDTPPKAFYIKQYGLTSLIDIFKQQWFRDTIVKDIQSSKS